MNLNPAVKGALAALAGFSCFALHDALIKSLGGYSVFQILFFAVLFSHVPFTFYLATETREANLRPRRPGWVSARALFMVGSAGFAFFAFANLPLAQTYAVLFSTPMLITLLAIPVLGEPVRLYRWFAVLMGLAGVVIVLRPGTAELSVGHLAALAAALCAASSAVITRKIGAFERGATLVLYPLLANVVLSGIVLTVVYQPMPFIDLAKMAAIGTLGIFAQVLIINAYRAAPATVVAPFQYSQMLWAVLYGLLWFDEVPDRFVFIGSAVIIGAGLLIVWRESRASVNQPYLNTRNLRGVSAAPMRSVECENDAGS